MVLWLSHSFSKLAYLIAILFHNLNNQNVSLINFVATTYRAFELEEAMMVCVLLINLTTDWNK
jgi:hypothetical protein